MSTGNTSRVFAAALAAKTRLDAQSWPPHPSLGVPQIAFADDDPASFAEIVSIIADVGDDSDIVWRTSPGSRDERFDLLFSITSATGETDQTAVVERLEELADVVQRAFYDDTAVDKRQAMLLLGIDGAMKLEGIGQVSFIVTTIDRIEGYVGRALVTYRLAFRI